GLRFRKHYRPVSDSRCEVDVAFTKWKVAIQLDGCFWHGCPDHGTLPKTNRDWWAAKFERNLERDQRLDHLLTDRGWTVLRYWEHEKIDEIVNNIQEVIVTKKLQIRIRV
ncbi:MAG: very short patch repair endonuclease, partial [Nitrososphaerales archaeon]